MISIKNACDIMINYFLATCGSFAVNLKNQVVLDHFGSTFWGLPATVLSFADAHVW